MYIGLFEPLPYENLIITIFAVKPPFTVGAGSPQVVLVSLYQLRPTDRYDVLMATTNSPEGLLDYEGLAAKLGISVESARAYNSRALDHRRKAAITGDPNHVRPGDLPAPDVYFGQSPAWRVETIEAWDKARPGRGVALTPPPTSEIPKVRRELVNA